MAEAKVPRIVIVVEGGVVSSVFSDSPAQYLVKDFDNFESDDCTFDPEGFGATDLYASPEAFREEVLADVKKSQLEPSGKGPFTFQFSLPGKDEDDGDAVRWINAPSRAGFNSFCQDQEMELDSLSVDVIGPFKIADGVDCVVDEMGKITEGEFKKS